MAKQDGSKVSLNLKAVEVIVKELLKIEEKDRSDVILFALKQIDMPMPNVTNLSNSVQTYAGGNVSPTTASNQTMSEFVKSKKPANEYQRVAVIAYYRERQQGKNEFTNAEMSQANTSEARQSKISNITNVVSKARDRYKLLTKGSQKGKHQLSTHGFDIVDALPDQEAAKRLIHDTKTRARKKRKLKE